MEKNGQKRVVGRIVGEDDTPVDSLVGVRVGVPNRDELPGVGEAVGGNRGKEIPDPVSMYEPLHVLVPKQPSRRENI